MTGLLVLGILLGYCSAWILDGRYVDFFVMIDMKLVKLFWRYGLI